MDAYNSEQEEELQEIAELYPYLSKEECRLALKNIEAYLEVLVGIYTRLEREGKWESSTPGGDLEN